MALVGRRRLAFTVPSGTFYGATGLRLARTSKDNTTPSGRSQELGPSEAEVARPRDSRRGDDAVLGRRRGRTDLRQNSVVDAMSARHDGGKSPPDLWPQARLLMLFALLRASTETPPRGFRSRDLGLALDTPRPTWHETEALFSEPSKLVHPRDLVSNDSSYCSSLDLWISRRQRDHQSASFNDRHCPRSKIQDPRS